MCVCVWGGLFGFVCGVGDIVWVKTYRIWFGKLYKLWTAGERNRMGLWVGESISCECGSSVWLTMGYK